VGTLCVSDATDTNTESGRYDHIQLLRNWFRLEWLPYRCCTPWFGDRSGILSFRFECSVKSHYEKQDGVCDDDNHHKLHVVVRTRTEDKPTVRARAMVFRPTINARFVKCMPTLERCTCVHGFITNGAFHCYDQSTIIPDFLCIWFGVLGRVTHDSSY